MNVIFISPHFPGHFYNFCARLKERSVQVLGIGDTGWENIGEACQQSLTDYRQVDSLHNYEAVYRVVAEYIFRYGRIDYVESENEYWLELDARIRSDFNISTGPRLEMMEDMNRKSRMKKAYKRAGVVTAKWILPASYKEASDFASHIGYPVIVKPDKGVGATSTYKLHFWGDWCNGTLYENSPVHFLENMPGDHPYISLYNQRKFAVCVGQGRWENEGRRTASILKGIFERKGIHGWVDFWDYDVDHDWPWWRKEIRYFLPWLLE